MIITDTICEGKNHGEYLITQQHTSNKHLASWFVTTNSVSIINTIAFIISIGYTEFNTLSKHGESF